jgi:hypothetical protein|tara:strand:- start:605 stop:871 length:267 start_codon:yes stop_codon:yes gene_type:complete
MGRITEAYDYINRDRLPTPRERDNIYTHLYDWHTLNALRRAHREQQELGEDIPSEDAERTTPIDRIRADLGSDIGRMRDVFEHHRHTD